MSDQIEICQTFGELQQEVVNCFRCPRLVAFREQVPPRKMYEHEQYWRRPVPGYGDINAWLLITGLAPAAHGGNRTGRIFTGDLSGKFLFEAMYEAGFANHPFSEYRDDGLKLKGCYMTAAVKCVPPKDKPLPIEIKTCNRFYQNELYLLKSVTHVLALGRIAFDVYRASMKARGIIYPSAKFMHGGRYELPGAPTLFASYHPSPQNTNTGKLTRQMFLDLLLTIKQDKESAKFKATPTPKLKIK